MIKRSVLNSIERKFILLVGDLIIAFVAINFLVSYGVDEKYVSLDLKFCKTSVYIVKALVIEFDIIEMNKNSRY